MPKAPAHVAAATVDGTIYVIGAKGVSITVQAYRVATNTWSQRKSLPVGWDHLNGASTIDGRIYVTGNYAGRALYAYNPATNTWARRADMPKGSSYGAQAVVNGRLYVYSWDKLFRYNPRTDRWVTLEGAGIRMDAVAAGIGGKLYLAGGMDELYLGVEALNVYDPATNTWTWKADMPLRLRAMARAVVNGKLYVAGGVESPWDDLTDRIVADLLIYNPATDRWTRKAPMPTKRYGAAGAAAGGNFFVIGGSSLRTVEVYTP
jgi:N-acetylneuraminic acid mutarotase